MVSRLALVAAAVSVLPAASAVGVRNETDDPKGNDTKPEKVVTYLTDVTKFCYQKLIKDSACCLDHGKAGAVQTTNVSRPGTQWRCNPPTCHDKAPGAKMNVSRGTDALWWPDGADCSTPRILYTHGGSFTGGGPFEWGYDTLGSKLAKMAGAVVMVTDYPLMDVGHFTSITKHQQEALLWLKVHGPDATDCSATPTPPLLLGGDSAGGGQTLSLLLSVHGQPGKYPEIAGTFAYSPWTNLASNTPTYYENAFSERAGHSGGAEVVQGDVIFSDPPQKGSREGREGGLEYVQGKESMLTDPIASPMFAGEAQLKGLAPIYLAVSGTEEMTSEVVIFAQKAANHGVAAVLDIYPGMWHVFPMYADGCGSGKPLWQGQEALERTAAFVQQCAARAKAGGAAPPAAASTFVHYPHPTGQGPWVKPPPINIPSSVSPPPALRR